MLPRPNVCPIFTRTSQSEGRVYKLKICLSVCLSVCLSSLQDFKYILYLYIIPGSRLTPHIIYCWVGYDVSCHLVMSMTHTKTNTQTKTNTKCFKDPMYLMFLKSRGFKDFKYDMEMNMSDMDGQWTWTWWTQR